MSIWRRPSPFYPVQTSSALESCRFLARLPSSPQVVSESHPAAICHWLGFPPEMVERKKKKETEHPLLPHSGSQHGGPVFSPVLYFKENCRWLEPPPLRATTNTEFWSYGNNWQDDLTIHRSELKWSHFQTPKPSTGTQRAIWARILQQKEHCNVEDEKTTTCSCVLRIRWISWSCDRKVTPSLKMSFLLI